MAPLQISLRIDKCFSEVLEYIEEKGGSGWCVREVAGDDNEHWHWFIETDAFKNIRAFRMSLTRAIPDLKGNAAYSAKECDENVGRYWQYMAKGDGDGEGVVPVWRHGLMWTDEFIEDLHRKYWEENHVFKKQKLEHIDEATLKRAMDENVKYDDMLGLMKIYIKELFKRNKPINLFSVKSHCNLISLKLAPDVGDAVDRLVNNNQFL